MVLEDSRGAATAPAEACDENPNCSTDRGATLPKSRANAHLCQIAAFCLFYIASLLPESVEDR